MSDLESSINNGVIENPSEEPAIGISIATEPTNIDIVVSGKSSTAAKKLFDADCTKCNKNFKNKKTYDKHVGQQICYNKDELSYCKTCNITLESHNGYIKHLMTAAHLESIGASKLERLQEERPSTIHTADPYLSSNEAELLGTRNLGEKYTLVFENNEIQEVKLVRKSSPTIASSRPPSNIPNPTPTNTNTNTKDKIKSIDVDITVPDKITQPTDNQREIIKFLEKQTNPIEANNNFIKILTTKLALEDYYGLSTLIRENCNISLEVKKTIQSLINKFVEGLTKKRAGGQLTYNNKDIGKVVVALSM